MATWHTRESVREVDAEERPVWADAESINDAVLDTILDVALDQVLAYAPALAADIAADAIPTRYVYGQLRQAQNIWNAGRVDAQGGVGDGDAFVMRPVPLDWHVKSILRPKRGRIRVR